MYSQLDSDMIKYCVNKMCFCLFSSLVASREEVRSEARGFQISPTKLRIIHKIRFTYILSLHVKMINWLIKPKFVCISRGHFNLLRLSNLARAEHFTALSG